MTKTKKEKDNARIQAKAQLKSIISMVKTLTKAKDKDDNKGYESALTLIHEDPLSVEVRSGWKTPGTIGETEEYRILLCTGGPAVQIIGNLGQGNEPRTASIQYQDWFTPWTDLNLSSDEEDDVLTYAQQFYYGD